MVKTRKIISSYDFTPQRQLLRLNPTVYHMKIEKIFELGERFVSLQADVPAVFYIWGHSYEFDIDDTRSRFEEFCRLISGRDDIFYRTDRQVLPGM